MKRLALPGYVFIAVPANAEVGNVIASARERVTVLGRPVGMDGKALLIDEGWLAELVLDPEGLLTAEYVPQPGEKIMMTAVVGPYAGYSGLVESVTNRQVHIIVEALHRALKITVPLHAVRRAA